jgi:Family of unknown function (DUF6272)
MDGLHQLKKKLDESGIFLSFSGPISQNLMVELGDILKRQMEMAEVETVTILKVFSVLVEQSQNILHHSAEALTDRKNVNEKLILGTIAVGYRDKKYFVLGGNKVKNPQVAKLKQRLESLKAMNKSELKELYKKIRKEGNIGDDKGAGLGLIDLARKSSEPIDYEFVHVNDEFSFFSIRTLI